MHESTQENHMKISPKLALFASLFANGTQGMAQVDEHKDHHPATTATAPISTPAAPAKVVASDNTPGLASMDLQTKRMHEMHDKMMNAKTPKERQALMGEHMKIMQDGMSMMTKMSSQGMSGMVMKQGMPADGKNAMKDGMADPHKMCERRMEMMQAMMQMMMDRLADSSTK